MIARSFFVLFVSCVTNVLIVEAKFNYVEQGIRRAQSGDLDGALQIFDDGLRAFPHDKGLLANTAIAYWQIGDHSQNGKEQREYLQHAQYLLKKSLVWDPTDEHSRGNLQRLLERLEMKDPSLIDADIDDYLLPESFLEPYESMDSSVYQTKEEDRGLPEPPPLPKDIYRRSEILFDFGYRAKAIDELCQKKHVLIELPEREIEQGFPSVTTVMKGSAVVKVCGFVMMKDAIPPDLTERIHREQDEWFDATYEEEIRGDSVLENANTYEATHFAIRSKGRFEFSNPLREPFTNKSIINSEFTRPIMARVMGENRLEIDTFSTVTSLPQTPVQHWHRDDGYLFTDITQSTPLSRTVERDRLINFITDGGKRKLEYDQIEERLAKLTRSQKKRALTHSRWGFYSTAMHLPPHGVVQFIPLRDVDLSMGPTQFVPGTQIHCTPEWEKEETLPSALDTFMSTFCPEASLRIIDTDATAGTSLLFDFRTLHRGGKNAHPSARRPLMYMTFFQEWYYDKVNFHQKQTRDFDKLSPTERKLLNRLDTKRYIRRLEERLESLYVDVGEEMESNYDFDVHGYDEKSQIEEEP